MITSTMTSYNAKFLAFQQRFTERKGNREKKGMALDFAVFMGVVVTHCSWSFLSHPYRIPKPTKDTQILKQENQLIKWKNSFKKWDTSFLFELGKRNSCIYDRGKFKFITEENVKTIKKFTTTNTI